MKITLTREEAIGMTLKFFDMGTNDMILTKNLVKEIVSNTFGLDDEDIVIEIEDPYEDALSLCKLELQGDENDRCRKEYNEMIEKVFHRQKNSPLLLSDSEKEAIGYIRNPLFRSYKIMQGNGSPVDALSNGELAALYEKMDKVIDEEGKFRRSLGDFDEMYVLELSGVKETLRKEIEKRKACKEL